MRHVATKEHQYQETVNIVKQFKEECDNFHDFFVWWLDGQYCFLLYSVNKTSYILY